MELLNYSYVPKKQGIACKEVIRPNGYTHNLVHMHDHHELVLVTSKASCRIVNNGSAVTLQTPCMLLNRAGTFHEVVQVSDGDYHSRVVFFHPQLLQGLPQSLTQDRLFAHDLLAVEVDESMVTLFMLLEKCGRSQQLPLLLALLAAVADRTPYVHLKRSESYIFEVLEALGKEGQPATVQQLADRFHVSPTKLKTDFKRITGLPIMTYRTKVRLDKASVLLTSTNMKQAQIAYLCGFSDESYFIRMFRRQFGMTPAAYRKHPT